MRHYAILAALIVGLTPLASQAQVFAINEDFNDAIPGPVQPGGIGFTFGGVSNGVNPFDPFPQEVISRGPGDQAYQISFDTSGVTPPAGEDFTFFFGGVGLFAGFFGEGSRTGGAVGATNPANWRFSIDVRAEGATDPNEVLTGSFVYFDPDFDASTGIDGDGNGDVNGADTYILDLVFADDPTDPSNDGFTTTTFTLDVGTGSAPRTEVNLEDDPDSPFNSPIFNDDGNWVINLNFGNGQFGNTPGNSIAIDNIVIEFIPPAALPGDYNADGVVNAADFTVWRDQLGEEITLPNEGEGVTPGVVTIEDYNFWVSQFGNVAPGDLVELAAVPEPASVIFAVAGLLACRPRRRS